MHLHKKNLNFLVSSCDEPGSHVSTKAELSNLQGGAPHPLRQSADELEIESNEPLLTDNKLPSQPQQESIHSGLSCLGKL